MSNKYDRLAILSISDVLAAIHRHHDEHKDMTSKEAKARVNIEGHSLKLNSLRLRTFAKHGVDCVGCGLKGKFFAVEKFKVHDVYHINLWGVNEQGEEVLLTHDHIIARTLGGADNIKNTQTMCSVCNFAKGTLEQKEKLEREQIRIAKRKEQKAHKKAEKNKIKQESINEM